MRRLFDIARRLWSSVPLAKAFFRSKVAPYLREVLRFDPGFYLERYPDVASSGLDPFEHYLAYGKREGRLPYGSDRVDLGRFEALDPSRQTVLVVSHEASRTGAPILSLNIAREFKRKYNVVTLLLGGGAITEEFRRCSDVVIGPLSTNRSDQTAASNTVEAILAKVNLSLAVINSIESRAPLPALAGRFVPTLCLIHEFATYTRPEHAFPQAGLWSDEVVFSTSLTRQDALYKHPELKARATRILHQGKCVQPQRDAETSTNLEEGARVALAVRPSDLAECTTVVLGAGTVHLRKGVDLFIDCAAHLLRMGHQRPFRFVWVGDRYDPIRDMQYSVYLEDQIRRSGLQKHVSILEETSNIEAAYKVADLMLISSRLDPMPNVAIDAMTHGLPVLCFEGTTGIADILTREGLHQSCVAPYIDTEIMARKLAELASSDSLRQEIGSRVRRLAIEEFDFRRYMDGLEELGAASAQRETQIKSDCREILLSKCAQLDFFSLPNLPPEGLERAILRYVRSWVTAIGRRKLFPGFHPGVYAERAREPESGADPLAQYIRAGRPNGPWLHEVITPAIDTPPITEQTRIALHLHVYYPELLAAALARLRKNQARPDLFISVPNAEVRARVEVALREYAGTVVEIKIVPNRGRDIGPFLVGFGRRLVNEYDLIGHIHTKKTEGAGDVEMGKTWYRFLLENLIGGEGRMADIILGRMSRDESIGIVFPDDPHVVGWEDNRPIAQTLRETLALGPLPKEFIFPVGTMFWVRSDAIEPIFGLDLAWEDFPEEPVPYDGSILHALERLFSLVASANGRRCVVTNVPGITR